MGFEKHEIQRRAKIIGEVVSINRQGQMIISVSFRKHFPKGSPCELYFDKEKRLIGIKPVKEASHITATIKGWGAGKNTHLLMLSSFLKCYKVSFDKPQRYNAHWDDEQKMLIVDVSKEAT